MKKIRSLLVATAILALSGRAGAAPGDRPYLEAAEKAAAWIHSSGQLSARGLAWPAVPGEPNSVADNLYSGMPGVILFFLEAHYSTGKAAYLQEAVAGADWLMGRTAGETATGLYEGLSGVAFSLEETFKASKDQKYRENFLACLARIQAAAVKSGEGVEWGPTTDIISGNAGTGLFLIYAYHETRDRQWLDLAGQAGRRLIELGKAENGGLKWAMDPAFPRLMPNFSHGTAGIAYFLASLYKETREKPFLDAALLGAKYLLSVASTEGGKCLVFHHEPDGKDLFYLGWCHGPVGTARLFYRLAEVTGDRTWIDWVRRSADGILKSGIPEKETPGFWNNDGICCGLAGVGEFFLDLGNTLRDPAYLDFAKKVTDRLLAKGKADDGKFFWVQAEHRTRPDFLVAQTGYMQGAAGIGMFLLELDAAGRGKAARIVFPDTPFRD